MLLKDTKFGRHSLWQAEIFHLFFSSIYFRSIRSFANLVFYCICSFTLFSHQHHPFFRFTCSFASHAFSLYLFQNSKGFIHPSALSLHLLFSSIQDSICLSRHPLVRLIRFFALSASLFYSLAPFSRSIQFFALSALEPFKSSFLSSRYLSAFCSICFLAPYALHPTRYSALSTPFPYSVVHVIHSFA